MVGLPNHAVLPPLWQQHHRPIAESTMTGLCRVHGASGPPVWPSQEPSQGPVYAENVPCRVQRIAGDREAEAATQQVTTAQYLATVPLDMFPDLPVTDTGPHLTVTGYKPGHAGDPHLIGRPLKVTSIQRGTLVWERDLTVMDDLTQGGAR